jgi:lipoate-protein ligase A
MQKEWRLIISDPADAVENMAIDEAIFLLHDEGKNTKTTFRIYNWSTPCVTLGYFQKYPDEVFHKHPIVRRMTGGLTVIHGKDISYSFVTNKNDWEHVYDQSMTYKAVHSVIKNSLETMGISTDFYEEGTKTLKKGYCVQTFFKYDLHSSGKKIVGSSQRRRNKTLLQQGSIHLDGDIDLQSFAHSAKLCIENFFNSKIIFSKLTDQEIKLKNELVETKYRTHQWNKKFK